MSRAECGIIGLCPMLTKDSRIKNCDECEAVEFAKEFMSDAVHETAKMFRKDGDGDGNDRV